VLAMRDAHVLSIGSISVEFRVRASRAPEPGESLSARDFAVVGGGRAATVALVARQLNAPVQVIARIGDDPLAEIALSPLRDAGVDLRGTRRVLGAATGSSVVWVRSEQENAVLSSSEANSAWSQEDAELVEKAVADSPSGSVVVPDLQLPGFIVERAVREAHRRTLSVVLHPNPPEAVHEDLFEFVDFVSPNRVEASQLTNVDVEDRRTALEAARRLVSRGARIVALRLDGRGVLFFDGRDDAFVESFAPSVTDCPGDAEVFTAALSVALREGTTSLEAVRFASAASFLHAYRQGARPRALVRAEVNRLAFPERG